MNIRVGMVSRRSGWEQLLHQEGLPAGIADLAEVPDPSELSVLIITRALLPAERESVEQYLRRGGAILGAAGHCEGISGTGSRRARLRYMAGGKDHGPFGAIGILDVDGPGFLPREATFLRTEDGMYALQAGELGGGWAVLLPFDPADAMTDSRATARMFPGPGERSPWERVSRTAKGEVRHLVRLSLEYLHHVRNLPYVHLWYYPGAAPSVVGLRVDTDGAGRRDTIDQYSLARSLGVGCTWFIDTGRALDLLPLFSSMEEQEFGVHCHTHRVLTDRSAAEGDLGRARNVMEQAGLEPRGCAAPYGIWSSGFARAVTALGFEYTSEFSFAYDTLPVFPPGAGGISAPLQVPIHPICPGSLLRAGGGERETERYFAETVRTRLRRRDPVLLYHHPAHRCWVAIQAAMHDALGAGALPVMFGSYARWWQERVSLEPRIAVQGETLDVTGIPGDRVGTFQVRVTRAAGDEALTKAGPGLEMRSLPWREQAGWWPPDDLRKTREFDLRTQLAVLHTALTRRRR